MNDFLKKQKITEDYSNASKRLAELTEIAQDDETLIGMIRNRVSEKVAKIMALDHGMRAMTEQENWKPSPEMYSQMIEITERTKEVNEIISSMLKDLGKL